MQYSPYAQGVRSFDSGNPPKTTGSPMHNPFCQRGTWGVGQSDSLPRLGQPGPGLLCSVLCCKIGGFLMSHHLWQSEPGSPGYSWARTQLCSLAIGRPHLAWFPSNGDRLAWEPSRPSHSSGWKVQGLKLSLCPIQIGLLMPTSWSCHHGLGGWREGWPVQTLSLGMSV